MFLSDFTQASFANPSTFIGKTVKKVGDSLPGKFFFKDAQKITRELPNGKGFRNSFGIAESGKSLRTSPFVVAGAGASLYGGYRVKKTYDKYKPEIKTGLKLARTYDQLKNRFMGTEK